MQDMQINKSLNRLLVLSAAAIPVLQVLNVNSMVSLLLVVVAVLVVISWLDSISGGLTGRDILVLAIILTAALNVFINASLEGQALSFSYLRKLVFFTLTLLCLQTASRESTCEIDKQRFYKLNTALSIFIVIMYFVYGNRAFVFNGIVTDYLVFHFSNPNLLGMFLGCITMIEFINAVKQTRPMGKVFHYVIMGVDFYFVLLTQSRNVVLAIIVFLVANSITLMQKELKSVNKKLAVVVVLWPLLFAALYLILVNNHTINELFSFLVSKGKDLNSRQMIWQYAISNFNSSPVFGAYKQVSRGTGMFQLHNTGLDTLASYGIVPSLLTFVFLYQTCLCRNEEFELKEQQICMNAYFSCLVMGMGEAGLFSGSLSYFVYVSIFLRMSGNAKREQALL